MVRMDGMSRVYIFVCSTPDQECHEAPSVLSLGAEPVQQRRRPTTVLAQANRAINHGEAGFRLNGIPGGGWFVLGRRPGCLA